MSSSPVQTVNVNGVDLAYKTYGEPSSASTILFVHGFPDTLDTWKDIAPAFAGEHFCISVAQRGYAPSGIPADGKYDAYTLGSDLLALATKLARDHVVLVGHDFGATAVWAAAAKDAIDGTHIVKRVVAESIPPTRVIRSYGFNARLLWSARHFIYFNVPFFNQESGTAANNYAYLDTLVQRWSPSWSADKAKEQVLDPVKRDFASPGRLKAALAYYKALGARSPELKTIFKHSWRVPALIFAGTEDGGGAAAPMIQTSHKCFEGYSEVVVCPNVGHFVHLEAPEKFVAKLREFLVADIGDEKEEVESTL